MKTTHIVHPFLFGLFPVLTLFADNIEQIVFYEIVMPTALILSVTLSLVFLLGLLLKNYKKSAIIVSVFLVLFFSFGYILKFLKDFELGKFTIGSNIYLTAICIIIVFFASYFVIKTKNELRNLTYILNVVAVSLFIIPSAKIVNYELKRNFSLDITGYKSRVETHRTASTKGETLPDIYYIIVDQYASKSTLKEIFDYDNSKFIDYLTNKSFYVASRSVSNYLKTAHSLASSLNMEYINYLSGGNQKSDDWTPLFKMIENNKVTISLKEKGYKYIHFGSWWGPTYASKYADVNIATQFLTEFPTVLFRTTMLYHNLKNLNIVDDNRRQQWRRVLFKFNKLAEIPNMKEPTFVFAHMLIPHHPYVFERNGDFVKNEDRFTKNDERYINQLILLNKKLTELIDIILLRSEVPPIIILQADEGPFPLRYRQDQFFDWEQATESELQEKTRILNAYYLPNTDNNALYPSITPVNTFRLIFNLYFNAHYDLLPDVSYAFKDEKHLYSFFDITDVVR